MKRFTSVLFVLVISLMAVAPASAATKETEIIEYVDVYELVDCSEVGFDFWIYNEEVGTIKVKSFYDEDGNLIKEKAHISGDDHLFAEGYPDKVVEGNFVINWTTWVDPETGEWTLDHNAGNQWHLNLPGYGNIVHITGTWDYQYVPSMDDWELIKEAGLFYVDLEGLCEYLEPQP